MGATAGIALAITGLKKLNDFNNSRSKQLQQGAVDRMHAAESALTPPTLPPPPDALSANISASKAMTEAARRYRGRTGAGFSSTLLTGENGDASRAPTAKKQLLGQ